MKEKKGRKKIEGRKKRKEEKKNWSKGGIYNFQRREKKSISTF